jgi:ribonucleotide reductase alpha subunit
MEKLAHNRGMDLTVSTNSVRGIPDLDWEAVRRKVRKGMRNATVMAVAPNANIGLVAGTSPGIDPRFAQMFSRNKISGKYLEVNPNLVHALKSEGLWDKYSEKILENHGDLQHIDGIPDHIKRIYKTSFDTAPEAFIEIAARAQKWVDQAISRNMYLASPEIKEIMDIYSNAWEKGLKTTYYLHMKPKHSAEQSTTSVNKSHAIGKKGFGSLFGTAPVKQEEVPVAEVEKEIVAEIITTEVEETPAIMEIEKVKIIEEKIQEEAEKQAEMPITPAPEPAPRPFSSVSKPTLILPDDPQNAFICEGCE